MPDGGARGVFDAYAAYYDVLYRDKDYAAEAAYVAGLIRRESPRAASVLELGCGSGGHAEHLASMGFTVHGLDVSEEMVARAQARRAGQSSDMAARMTFAVSDARTARTGATYDAVVSLFNVIGYQTGDTDLTAMFRTAAAHLSVGGVFLFDFWNGPAVQADPPGVRVKRFENADIRVTRIGEPVIHPAKNVIDVTFNLFVEDRASGDIRHLTETHSVRYLFPDQLERFYDGMFESRGSYMWMTEDPLGDTAWAGVQILSRV